MLQLISPFLTFLGGIVAFGGGAAAISYALFTWLGKKWLDQKFSERLERLRHEHSKETEQLRHEINSLFSRVSKIHEREFTVLPAAWLKLNEAYGRISVLCSSLKEFPDLRSMVPAQCEEFLQSCRLPEYAKEEIRTAEASQRNAIYQKAIFWVELSEARSARNDFHNHLIENRIFMTDGLWDAFTEVDSKLSEALINYEIAAEDGDSKLKREASKLLGTVTPAVHVVEREVQKRLHYEQA